MTTKVVNEVVNVAPKVTPMTDHETMSNADLEVQEVVEAEEGDKDDEANLKPGEYWERTDT